MSLSRHRRDAVIFLTVIMMVYVGNVAYVVASELPAFGPPVGDGDLKTISGGADLSLAALSEQAGTVTHNSVNGNSVTGTINFDGQAFQNLNGLAVISANTGNNVSINSTMQVNIAIGAAP